MPAKILCSILRPAFLATLHGEGSMEHLNQGLDASTVTSVDLLQTLPGAAEGAEKPNGRKNRWFVMNEAELWLCSKFIRDTVASPKRDRGLMSIEE